MTRFHSVLAVMVCVVASSTLVADQEPAPPAAIALASPTPAPPAAPTPPVNYTYTVEGRRDPFAALINRTGQQRGSSGPAIRMEGLPGIGADELTVRGILQSRGEWIAMVSGASGKVYTVRPGDRLADGVVQSITSQALIILQQVNDPLSLEKQREVHKTLRGGENK